MTTISRTVRVFLSSTFRDFAEERDLLVRKVFPELRRKCRERQVELVDVDLRWGITEEEAQQGKVIPICLAEIDRSRPFFMGFIGERYGWIPEQEKYDLSLIMEQPWLDEHRGGKSVTELEMLHGVLNNPAMEDRAFFYFRDPKWSQKKGGAYLCEGSAEKEKLEALKNRIRQSGFPVVEDYPTPEALAERVKEDLWKLIDEAFPESEVPDALAQERMRHEVYSATRMRLYLGGEKYFQFLDAAMKAKAFKPVLVSGQSGGGKSSLLANWTVRWSKTHPKTTPILHHLGCGADAADPVRMATRIMQEIARITGEEFKLESDPDKMLEKLPESLAIASAWAEREKRELLIVLDGLDKVSDRQHLRWFPAHLPPKVKLLASCLDGEVLEAAKRRMDWSELKVKPFTRTEQSRFIREYLGRYRKSLTAPQRKSLQSHPLCGNPLFLLTVLEELRVFGLHEKLQERLQVLLSPPASKGKEEEPTVDDVFEHVLARIEEDLGKKPVQSALEAIWASRSGLFQEELLSIAKLAPAHWAAIQIALDESLYDGGGKINFGHDYLRKAVEDKYKITAKRKKILHHILAQWFSRREITTRVAYELPWQLHAADKKIELKNFLLDYKHIYQMERGGFKWTEFFTYWSYCGESDVRKYLQKLTNLLEIKPSKIEIQGVRSVGRFLAKSRWRFVSVEFDRLFLDLAKRVYGQDHEETINASTTLGNHLGEVWTEDSHKEAEELLRFVYNKRRTFLLENDPQVVDAQHDLGVMLSKSMLKNEEILKEATFHLETALQKTRNIYGALHFETFVCMNNLGIHYWRINKRSDALELLELSSTGTEKLLGPTHPDSLLAKNNLAAMMRDSQDFVKSEKLLRKTLEGMEINIGRNHRDTLGCLQDIAMLLDMNGNTEGSSEVNAEIFRRRGLVPPAFTQN
jgi:nephrocystin-3